MLELFTNKSYGEKDRGNNKIGANFQNTISKVVNDQKSFKENKQKHTHHKT